MRHETGTGHVVSPRNARRNQPLARQLRHHQAVVGGTQTGRDSSVLGSRYNVQRRGIDPRGWDGTRGTRCFIERFPANLDIAPLGCPSPRLARQNLPAGVMDPRREGKGSPPGVGIRFHIGAKRIPGSLGALCPARPLCGMGHGTGTGRMWPIACRPNRSADPS
jgi:hypothetical protein